MLDFVEIQEKDLELNIIKEETFKESKIEQQEQYSDIKDNGTLLISEIQNKVILPYTAEEIRAAIDDETNYYKSAEEVIQSRFTRPLSYYRDLHVSRFKEAVKLLTERDEFSKLDGYNLGLEMFSKRYLHPAIISACKNLDELNVYLDCLDKNELDDFKIFEIKYELFPMIIDENKGIYKVKNLWKKIKEFFKKIFSKDIKKDLESAFQKGKH